MILNPILQHAEMLLSVGKLSKNVTKLFYWARNPLPCSINVKYTKYWKVFWAPYTHKRANDNDDINQLLVLFIYSMYI